MELLNVQDDVCWVCGKAFNSNIDGHQKTTHHCLSQCLNPVKNITVPVHEKCHGLINSNDTQAMNSFAYKIMKETKELNKKVGTLVERVNASK